MARSWRIVHGSSSMRAHPDRREAPRYTSAEVAKWLKLPPSTVWAWFFGQPNFKPLLVPADREANLLSFYNLVEAHAISWTKNRFPRLRTERIRTALECVRENIPGYERPLVTKRFSTEGKSLFIKSIEESGKLENGLTVNASRWGQLVLPVLSEILELIEYDQEDLARLLYPERGKKLVVINPHLASGRPVLKGTGVLASVIWQRARRANEPIDRLANDYRLEPDAIKAAIDYIEAA